MRFFTLLIAVWILVLSVQPCADVFSAVDAQGHSVEQVSHIDQPSKGNDNDGCSPFCVCSCCSISIAYASLPFTVTVDLQNRPITPILVEYSNPYTPNYNDSIWQPPKV